MFVPSSSSFSTFSYSSSSTSSISSSSSSILYSLVTFARQVTAFLIHDQYYLAWTFLFLFISHSRITISCWTLHCFYVRIPILIMLLCSPVLCVPTFFIVSLEIIRNILSIHCPHLADLHNGLNVTICNFYRGCINSQGNWKQLIMDSHSVCWLLSSLRHSLSLCSLAMSTHDQTSLSNLACQISLTNLLDRVWNKFVRLKVWWDIWRVLILSEI